MLAIALLALAAFSDSHELRVEVQPDLEGVLSDAGRPGTFVLYDVANGRMVEEVSRGHGTGRRFSGPRAQAVPEDHALTQR